MHRPFLAFCVLFIILTGIAQAGPPDCDSKSCCESTKGCNFGKAYYIEDGHLVVVPYGHGFYYKHGVETPEGVRFKPGDTFVQYDRDKRVERDYWLMRVNWFNNKAVLHEQAYHYKIVENTSGKLHPVRGKLVGSGDITLTHFRGLVAFDHSYSNMENHPGTQFWRSRQSPLRIF